jgi:septum formation protein
MKKKIILSSNSPRRKELLAGLGLPFEVRVVKGVSEGYPHSLPAAQVPLYIAREKAAAYQVAPDELVITADTVVVIDQEVLGKPHSPEEAVAMLTALSGRTHRVITGVCLTTDSEQHAFAVETEVSFKPLTDKEIHYYVDNYKPFDKAGSYGIQEWIGYIGVTSIHGSYFNVMGLPIQRIYQELDAMIGPLF